MHLFTPRFFFLEIVWYCTAPAYVPLDIGRYLSYALIHTYIPLLLHVSPYVSLIPLCKYT